MKKIFLILGLTLICNLTYSQGVITPTSIEIGDMHQLPHYDDNHWDGPLKVVSGNLSNGVIVLKQTNAGKIGGFHALNSENDAIYMGMGGPNRPYDFEKNCAMIKTVEQYGSGNLKYFVIGNRDSKIPIVFVQEEHEVLRIDEDGNIKIKNPNSGVVLTSPNGTEYKITVDDNGNLTTSQATSSKSLKVNYDVDIFPNPTENKLTISVKDQNIHGLDAEIYDLTGKRIFRKNYSTNDIKINTSNLSSGAYLIKLKDSDGNLIKTEKFIKQ